MVWEDLLVDSARNRNLMCQRGLRTRWRRRHKYILFRNQRRRMNNIYDLFSLFAFQLFKLKFTLFTFWLISNFTNNINIGLIKTLIRLSSNYIAINKILVVISWAATTNTEHMFLLPNPNRQMFVYVGTYDCKVFIFGTILRWTASRYVDNTGMRLLAECGLFAWLAMWPPPDCVLLPLGSECYNVFFCFFWVRWQNAKIL